MIPMYTYLDERDFTNPFDVNYDLYEETAEILIASIVSYDAYYENGNDRLDPILEKICDLFPYAVVDRELIEMDCSKIHIECMDTDLQNILNMLKG